MQSLNQQVHERTVAQHMAAWKRPIDQVREQIKGKRSYSMWYSDSSNMSAGTPKTEAQHMAASKRPIHQVREQIKGKGNYSMWYSNSSTPDYADSKGKIQLPMMMPVKGRETMEVCK